MMLPFTPEESSFDMVNDQSGHSSPGSCFHIMTYHMWLVLHAWEAFGVLAYSLNWSPLEEFASCSSLWFFMTWMMKTNNKDMYVLLEQEYTWDCKRLSSISCSSCVSMMLDMQHFLPVAPQRKQIIWPVIV